VKLSPKPRVALLQLSLRLPKKLLQRRQRRLLIKELLELEKAASVKDLAQDCPRGCGRGLGLYSDSLVCCGGHLVGKTDH
jgi:hypothetical protein